MRVKLPIKQSTLVRHDGRAYSGEAYSGEAYSGEAYSGEAYDSIVGRHRLHRRAGSLHGGCPEACTGVVSMWGRSPLMGVGCPTKQDGTGWNEGSRGNQWAGNLYGMRLRDEIARPLLNVHRLKLRVKLREIKPVQMWTRHRLYRKSQDCSLRQQGQDLMSGQGAPTQNTQTEHPDRHRDDPDGRLARLLVTQLARLAVDSSLRRSLSPAPVTHASKTVKRRPRRPTLHSSDSSSRRASKPARVSGTTSTAIIYITHP